VSAVITPTPGRIVWFWPAPNDNMPALAGQPLAAIVAAVHDDRRINLCVFDAYGQQHSRQNIHLVQPGDDEPSFVPHATWMPYQISAAGIAPQAPAPAPESDPNSEGSTAD
jgi:hypothetical protein